MLGSYERIHDLSGSVHGSAHDCPGPIAGAKTHQMVGESIY
jgi:hypothetical protein